jgi:transcription initiation factor TFIIB
MSISDDSHYHCAEAGVSAALHAIQLSRAVEEQQLSSKKDIECDICHSMRLIEREGHVVCIECGTMGDSVLDTSQEWRTFTDSTTKGKSVPRCDYVAVNDLFPNMSMGVVLNNAHKGKYNSYQVNQVCKLQYWRHVSYKDAKLYAICVNIGIIAQNNGITSYIADDAKYMFIRVQEHKKSKMIGKECMIASSVSIACKKNNVARSCDEICSIFSITNKKVFWKSLKLFEEIWQYIQTSDADIDADNVTDVTVSIVGTAESLISSAHNYLHRACCNLGVSDELYEKCKSVCNRIDSANILEKHTPLTRTAAIIHYVVDTAVPQIITKSEIAVLCQVSEQTITICVNKIIMHFSTISISDTMKIK